MDKRTPSRRKTDMSAEQEAAAQAVAVTVSLALDALLANPRTSVTCLFAIGLARDPASQPPASILAILAAYGLVSADGVMHDATREAVLHWQPKQ